jgi:hypothetical protein
MISGNPLYLSGGFLHLSAILLIRGGDVQRQQMAQCVHRRMHLRSFAALGAVVAATCARLRSGLCSVRLSTTIAVGRGLRPANSRKSEPKSSTMTSKHPGPYPAPRLLVYHRPRRQIVRHHPPVRPRLHQPAQRVAHRTQAVRPLPGILPELRQIRRYKGPLLITHIARITNLTLVPHPPILHHRNRRTTPFLQQGINVINRL